MIARHFRRDFRRLAEDDYPLNPLLWENEVHILNYRLTVFKNGSEGVVRVTPRFANAGTMRMEDGYIVSAKLGGQTCYLGPGSATFAVVEHNRFSTRPCVYELIQHVPD